ncbi:MAG TPA: cytochrome c biogenesis protein CcdA [Chromatiales bacterium]|nr:cytochrome c biogenesis protein CcdA [Chromatiales bacterium]
MDTASITTPLAFLAGLLSFISPCVLPLVPVYLGYLSGSSVTDEEQANRWHIFSHALFFVGGFTLIFTLVFGLPATFIGESLNQYSTIIANVGGVLVILFGLHTIGILNIPFLNMTKQVTIDHGSTPGYIRSSLIGMAFAAGWTPCIGPLLGAVMTMAMTNPSQGVYFTLTYALGLAVPFLIAAALLTQATDALRRLNKHARIVQWVSGLFLIAVGLLLISGKFTTLNAFFIQFTPDWLVEHL